MGVSEGVSKKLPSSLTLSSEPVGEEEIYQACSPTWPPKHNHLSLKQLGWRMWLLSAGITGPTMRHCRPPHKTDRDCSCLCWVPTPSPPAVPRPELSHVNGPRGGGRGHMAPPLPCPCRLVLLGTSSRAPLAWRDLQAGESACGQSPGKLTGTVVAPAQA